MNFYLVWLEGDDFSVYYREAQVPEGVQFFKVHSDDLPDCLEGHAACIRKMRKNGEFYCEEIIITAPVDPEPEAEVPSEEV